MFFPSGVGIFDNTLMLKRGGGGTCHSLYSYDTYRNSKDVRSLKVPSSISNK